MLSVTGYRKKYNDTLILQIDQLTLPLGIYWIKGQNGSGKSTFFKSVAGLIPFDGKIVFDHLDLKSKAVEYRKVVNFSEAEPTYPGFLTAKDLIRFIGKAKAASKENIEATTKYFDVDTFYEKPCETFSSGMLKKLSLTLAFIGNPRMIILDEPLITLDEQTRLKMVGLMKNYLNRGVMFLVSSHQPIDEQFEVDGSFEIKDKGILRV